MMFSDLDGHWAKTNVLHTVDAGLFSGVSDTAFAPDQPITRGMFVTTLSRLYEQSSLTTTPSVSSGSFTDVTYSSCYGDAVAWAADCGIVSGVSAVRFAPDQPVTREEMAVMLNKYLDFMEK